MKQFIFCITKNELIHRYISKILPTFQEQLSVSGSIILLVFFIARSIFLKTKIEPYSNVLGEIILGLNRFNLIKHVQKRPDVFKVLFCKSDLFKWTLDKFVKALQIDWSRSGSNEKKVELECYKAFKEMLDITFHDCKMKEVFL